jgi:hypothetical protein
MSWPLSFDHIARKKFAAFIFITITPPKIVFHLFAGLSILAATSQLRQERKAYEFHRNQWLPNVGIDFYNRCPERSDFSLIHAQRLRVSGGIM